MPFNNISFFFQTDKQDQICLIAPAEPADRLTPDFGTGNLSKHRDKISDIIVSNSSNL